MRPTERALGVCRRPGASIFEVMPTANYTPAEEKAMAAALKEGRPPACPRCRAETDRREVPPKPDVPYVRDRIWVVCRGCHRSAVFDRRRVEGG